MKGDGESTRRPPEPEIAELENRALGPNDGIEEEDNPIPLWFNLSFGGTIVFAIVYMVWVTVTGWSQAGQYARQVEEAEALIAAHRAAQPLPTENPFHGDAAAASEGRTTFDQICAACHKADGSGLVGPSLVDPYWKYGHSDSELYMSVAQGRPGGMPGWEAQLGTEKIWKVLSYLETLPRSDEPGVGAPGAKPALATGS